MTITQIISVGTALDGAHIIIALDNEGDLWQGRYFAELNPSGVTWQFLGGLE